MLWVSKPQVLHSKDGNSGWTPWTRHLFLRKLLLLASSFAQISHGWVIFEFYSFFIENSTDCFTEKTTEQMMLNCNNSLLVQLEEVFVGWKLCFIREQFPYQNVLALGHDFPSLEPKYWKECRSTITYVHFWPISGVLLLQNYSLPYFPCMVKDYGVVKVISFIDHNWNIANAV